MCVRGGGSVTSFKVNFNFQKFQGCPMYVIRGVGGGQTFFQGSGVQLLSDRTYDLYWTPVSTLDLSNYLESYSTAAILSLAVYFYLSSCTHLGACFTLI